MSNTNTTDKIMSKLLNEHKNENKTIKQQILDAKTQIPRLINKKWKNPYDVLLLNFDSDDSALRRHYKLFTLALHPDKCDIKGAREAFSVVVAAYKTIQIPEKRRIYQRIMKEAWNKTIHERKNINKERKKKGLERLPDDTFDADYQSNCRRLFDEIDEKKNQLIRMEEMTRLQRNEKLEMMAMKEQYRRMTEEEWDRTREKRIKKWKTFQKKSDKIGNKGYDGRIKLIQKPKDKVNRF